MLERFTDRARKVMQLANQEAQRFNHEYIGTEHILLGLVKEGSGVAANVLKNLDIDLHKIRLDVEKVVQSGPEIVMPFKLPQTPRAKKVIEYSLEEARHLNHKYVGTEHLLLGLLRDQETVAGQVLLNLGLKLEDVREEILNMLGQNIDSGESASTPRRQGPTETAGQHSISPARLSPVERGARKTGLFIHRHRDGWVIGCSTFGTLAGLLGGAVFFDLTGAVLAGAALGLLLGSGCATLLPE